MDEWSQFAALFTGLPRAYLKVTLLDEYDGKKRKSIQVCVREQLTQDLYKRHLEGKQGLGVYPVDDEGLCSFGVMDIDIYEDWTQTKLATLCTRIEKYEMRLVPCRSKSGGVRLYVFCEPIKAINVIKYLKYCAALLGFSGQEVFPITENLVADKGDVGRAIALPYFGSRKNFCAGFDKEGSISLEAFLISANEKRCKLDDIKNMKSTGYKDSEAFADGPPCLQSLAANGFPESYRNLALFNIAVFLKMALGDDGLEKHIMEYHQKFINPPIEDREIKSIINSVTKKSYFYKCKEAPICNFCNKDLCLTRKFGIGNALQGVRGVTIDSLQKINTTPPIWLISINNHALEMTSEDLLNVSAFTKVCLERLNLIPSSLTQKMLRALVQQALGKSPDIDAPEELTPRGQMIELFEQFLASTPPAKKREDLLYKKPWYAEEYVYFRGKDFMDYLEIEKFNKLDKNNVYKALVDYNISLGSTEEKIHTLLKVDGKPVRVWKIKHEMPRFTEEFNEEKVEF